MQTLRVSRRIPARIAAVAVAVFSLVPFFGLVDLSVSIVPAWYPEFATAIVDEGAWGLLFSLLVPVPLLAWAAARVDWADWQLCAVAVGVAAGGVVTVEWAQVGVGAAIAAVAALTSERDAGVRAWRVTGAGAAAAAVGLAGALVHVRRILALRGEGLDDSATWGLDHLAMQAGFALALPLAAAVAITAAARSSRLWQLALAAPALSALWFGLISARHPDLTGSLGVAGGAATMLWAVAVVAAGWHARTRARAAT